MSDPQPVAGWYPDPSTAGTDRYWDGAAWAEQRRPTVGTVVPASAVPAGVAPAGLPSAGPMAVGPAGSSLYAGSTYVGPSNAAAIVGLVLALTGVILPAGILTLIGGIVSIVGLCRAAQLKAAGYLPVGRGVAIAGIIIGFALTVFAIIAIVAIVIALGTAASGLYNFDYGNFG